MLRTMAGQSSVILPEVAMEDVEMVASNCSPECPDGVILSPSQLAATFQAPDLD